MKLLISAIIAFVYCLGLSTASAQPSLFVANYYPFKHSLQSSDLDGQNIKPVIGEGYGGIYDFAVDPYAQHIYAVDSINKRIYRTDFSGKNEINIIDQTHLLTNNISLDLLKKKVYWDENVNYGNGYNVWDIYRANLDGTNIEKVISLAPILARILSTDLYNTHYFGAFDLDLPNNTLYFSLFKYPDSSNGSTLINSISLDGKNLKSIAYQDGLADIVFNPKDGKLYYSGDTSHSIRRADPKCDKKVCINETIAFSEEISPFGLALDTVSNKIFYTDPVHGAVYSVGMDGYNNNNKLLYRTEDEFAPLAIAVSVIAGYSPQGTVNSSIVKFKWKTSSLASKYRLTVKDASGKVVLTATVPVANVYVTRKLTPGKYVWSIERSPLGKTRWQMKQGGLTFELKK